MHQICGNGTGGDGFRCANDSASCYPKTWICDGANNCPDHSDERNCLLPAITTSTSVPRTLHNTALLLPFEYSLTEKPCSSGNYFWCLFEEDRVGSGRCVLKNYTCNGFMDCLGGSDELDCPRNQSISMPSTTPLTTPLTTKCRAGQFKCNSGECIGMAYRCDGFPYSCRDNSDELDCPKLGLLPFKLSAFQKECQNASKFFWCRYPGIIGGRCVPLSFNCDGFVACLGGTDEQNCSNISAPVGNTKSSTVAPLLPPYSMTLTFLQTSTEPQFCQTAGALWCRYTTIPSLGRCIPSAYRCDGDPDCLDGSDEQGCPAQQQLPTTSTPSPSAFLSDESSLSTNSPGLPEFGISLLEQQCRNPTNFWCFYSHGLRGRCVPEYFKCDGIINCLGGTDEQHCPESVSRLT
ncbi:putative Low-density lipoprotein receptor-related protein 2 [Hypsibius exemplaris]|uniref:Low-density lipoprotein receptor-related protein 2 n=1 Tax=Hypsibius exemplaris TaxID=2072580 RepID=A0A9X6NKU1_HYPEX|nr:putative Low-density lipoprotein receptor-related protein 2 [Hypsibius exemplaris]